MARFASSHVPMLYTAALPEVNCAWASAYPVAEKPSWKQPACPSPYSQSAAARPGASENFASPVFSFCTYSGPACRKG